MARPAGAGSSSASSSSWTSKEVELEVDRIDFAEAYLVASAETTGVETIASFDRSIDRVPTVRRVEPA